MLTKVSFILTICSFWVSNSSQFTGKFWHVTDIHWDLNYTRFGGDPDKMCWAAATSKDDGEQEDVGEFGNHACDAPWTLVTSAMRFMKSRLSEPDFILWTGDDDSHVANVYFNKIKVRAIMMNVTRVMNETFPRTPVVPTYGNHDAFPASQFSAQPFNEWYREVADIWQPWLGQQAHQSFRLGGYYTRPHPTVSDVTIVALNTNVYYDNNKLVSDNSNDDPLDQLTWLNQTLTRLANNGHKVYITAHIPPGVSGSVGNTGVQWFQPLYNQIFVQIITQHSDIIIGQFYGHEHSDAFRLFYDDEGKVVNSLFVAPAVTPWNYINNPAVRLFTYDLHTGQILNYEQYYLNLTEANEMNAANWQLEYDFLSAYNLPDMSHQSIGSLVDSFKEPENALFNRYIDHNTADFNNGINCTKYCKHGLYCSITQLSTKDYLQCLGIK